MTCRELIRRTAEQFSAAGIPDSVNDAALLLSDLTGISPLSLRLDEDTVLDYRVVEAYQSYVEQRLQRIPLQYILGKWSFMGLPLFVGDGVLIPRDEFYADQSLQYVSEQFGGSLPKFIAAFTSKSKLSREEAEELKRMIDNASED